MTDRDRKRGSAGLIAFLVLLFLVAGGWNYHRNWKAESANEDGRPYGNYAVDDLESLRAAYAVDLSGVKADFDSAKRNRTRPVGDIGSIAANVEQFQRTSRSSTAIRSAAASVSERQDQIEELDRELALRAHFGRGLARHLKRLIAI